MYYCKDCEHFINEEEIEYYTNFKNGQIIYYCPYCESEKVIDYCSQTDIIFDSLSGK